jgi:hypothetical protein
MRVRLAFAVFVRRHKLSLRVLSLLRLYPLLKISDNGVLRALSGLLLTLVNQPLDQEIFVHVFFNYLLRVSYVVCPLKVFKRLSPFLLCKNHYIT